ncbi:MAG: metallophosphoesterase [Muribaculaceae bacterium]|nr:metallophosphoesterase [Muribaculaceae bacterium]
MTLIESLRSLKAIPEVQYVAELLLNADRKEGEMLVLYDSWDEIDGERVDWSKSTEPQDAEISDIKTVYNEDNEVDFVHRIVGMPEISLYYYPIGSSDWRITLEMDIPNIPEMEDTPSLYSLFRQSRFASLFRHLYEVEEDEIVTVCIDMGCDINDAAKLISYYIRYYECDKEDKKYKISVWWDGCDKEEEEDDSLKNYYVEAKDMLIIPDVHGRKFWKEAVARYPDADTIFLGDYHDPYPDEGISEQESLENFKEIVEYAKTHRNCQLLLGNHDLHYICNFGEACRLDYANSAAIHHLLYDNLWLFKIADIRRIGYKTVLFTHAPVLTDWIREVGETDNASLLTERLNRLLPDIFRKPWEAEDMLTHTSFYRGGFGNFGSPIWADMREINDNVIPTVDYSIFAHTQRAQPVITDRWANIDCHRAFILTPHLKLIEVEGS